MFIMSSNVHFDFSIPTNPEDLTLLITKKKLEKKAAKLRNTTESEQSKSANTPAKACDINDISWLLNEKCKMIDFMKNDSKETDLDLPESDVELYINLYETLVKENYQHSQLLEYKKQELEEEKAVLTELRESLHLMKTNMNALQTSENNDPDMLDLNLLKKNSSIKFQETRRYLHMLLESCFVDNKFKDLIKVLTEAYFKGGDDKYIEITDNIYYPHIALLKQASLIVQDPYNEKRIKFDDLAQKDWINEDRRNEQNNQRRQTNYPKVHYNMLIIVDLSYQCRESKL